jgi:hypothetical protein
VLFSSLSLSLLLLLLLPPPPLSLLLHFAPSDEQYLKLVVVFVILATFSNEQSDFINRVHQVTLLTEKLPEFKYVTRR